MVSGIVRSYKTTCENLKDGTQAIEWCKNSTCDLIEKVDGVIFYLERADIDDTITKIKHVRFYTILKIMFYRESCNNEKQRKHMKIILNLNLENSYKQKNNG
jgi:hypothetical protein